MSMATFSPMIETMPNVLVIGAGHAGASVAAAAVEAGLQTTVWGRRPLAELSSAFKRLGVDYRQMDWWEQPDPGRQLEDVHWLVLADEPRDIKGTDHGRQAHSDRAEQRYRMLETVGFTEPSRSVVRIGSPAGERPDPTFSGARDLPYVRLKLLLAQRADEAAARGLRLSTIAPAEIHSPYSTYSDDPYRLGLARLKSLSVVHDVPVAAVSDQSLGEAVLLASALATPGSWLEVADGTLGPGRALQMMASTLGRSPLPPLVEWLPGGSHHLFDVLHHRAAVDLDHLIAGTRGWEHELAPLRSVRDAQSALAGASFWWAGADAVARARRTTGASWGAALGSMARAVGQQVGGELLGVMLALGTDRTVSAIDDLDSRLRSERPPLASRLLDPTQPTATERAQRLSAAVERQAARSSM